MISYYMIVFTAIIFVARRAIFHDKYICFTTGREGEIAGEGEIIRVASYGKTYAQPL